MEVKQPTQEQQERLWKWCGFKYEDYNSPNFPHQGGCWIAPDGKPVIFEENEHGFSRLPLVDLNNLFKHAVPKLRELGVMSIEFIQDLVIKNNYLVSVNHQPFENASSFALALFWAIYKAAGWRSRMSDGLQGSMPTAKEEAAFQKELADYAEGKRGRTKLPITWEEDKQLTPEELEAVEAIAIQLRRFDIERDIEAYNISTYRVQAKSLLNLRGKCGACNGTKRKSVTQWSYEKCLVCHGTGEVKLLLVRASDQSLPESPYTYTSKHTRTMGEQMESGCSIGYFRCQQDMIKAGFRRVVNP